MDIINFNTLLPLIPAFSIVLVLILVYSIYKFQVHLKSGRPSDPTEDIDEDEDDDVHIRIKDKTAPLIIPRANESRGVSPSPVENLHHDSEDQGDNQQFKPLFLASTNSTPPPETEKSCGDLYKELMDSEKYEEDLYQELVDNEAPRPQPTPTAEVQTPTIVETKAPYEQDDEFLLSEIENELKNLGTGLPHEATPTVAKKEETTEEEFDWEKYFAAANREQASTPEIIQTPKPAPKEPEKIIPNVIPLEKKSSPQQKPIGSTSEKNTQYLDRLKTFQNKLEQRFGTLEIANTEKKKPSFAENRKNWLAQSEKNQYRNEEESLELLESFLFTANQRRGS